MKKLSDLKFKGKFRIYQTEVLDNAEKYLGNKKINIVAAPGSGKTVLGLELIRRLNAPALVFSPTLAIRDQWKARFGEFYLSESEKIGDWFSTDLHNPEMITSVTYQGLYSAFKKNEPKSNEESDETNCENSEEIEEYSGIDIIKLINDKKITTVCLDEAHHLRSEWEKTLYDFIKKIDGNVDIIALTATPPYDSDKAEWNRYIEMCGEIDDEISVPELVKTGTICPHQDYVALNYPTGGELNVIKEYREKIAEFTASLFNDGAFMNIITESKLYRLTEEEDALNNPMFLKSLVSYLKAAGRTENIKLLTLFGKHEIIPSFNYSECEILINGILSDKDVFFNKKERAEVKSIVSSYGLSERNKVVLCGNSKIEKITVSSIGKLISIQKIIDAEYNNLGDNLRLLILSDYIRNGEKIIGTDKPLNKQGVIPIFELIRRKFSQLKTAVLSGSAVIVPECVIKSISIATEKRGMNVKFDAITNTNYSYVLFGSAKNSEKVCLITELFNRGEINVIVGTKSLLGEGWDSPAVNTLILASFVGSYMLSNQMRGRAIRIDKSNPEKVADIWHLCTVLPQYMNYENWKDKLTVKLIGDYKENNLTLSPDYLTLTRRFTTFMGLNYETDEIENGLERISYIKPPFDGGKVEEMNRKTFAYATNRSDVKNKWSKALCAEHFEIVRETEEKKRILHGKYYFFDCFAAIILMIAASLIYRYTYYFITESFFCEIVYLIISVLLFIGFACIFRSLWRYFSKYRQIKEISEAILMTFKKLHLIGSGALPNIEYDKRNFTVKSSVINCTVYEKNLFYEAVGTFLSPIENPRYLVVKGLFLKEWDNSFAVPEEFSGNSDKAHIFLDCLSKKCGNYSLYYTRNAQGRKILIKCRKHSFISLNYMLTYGKKRLKEIWKKN